MTGKANQVIELLQDELKATRRITARLGLAELDGDVFTEVNGVTVKIGPAGAIDLPALRSYLDGVNAAVNADLLFVGNGNVMPRTL